LKECLDAGEDAILLFSGGATKSSKGCSKTEGQSYLDLCRARNFFGFETSPPTLRRRTFAEEWATDSYQNVLLSLLQYPAFTRASTSRQNSSYSRVWPQKLIIVSHAFKRARFLDLHLPAIAAPLEDVQFIGIDPPFDEQQLADVIEGDRLRGYGVWQHDLRGTGRLLSQKRLARGWDEAAFVEKCISDHENVSLEARLQLQALVKGQGDMIWPETLHGS
jgi:hypothetical protein